MITEAKVQRAYSRLFRKEATEAGLRGESAWSAIYGEAHLMPHTIQVLPGQGWSGIRDAMDRIRPGGTIIVLPQLLEDYPGDWR